MGKVTPDRRTRVIARDQSRCRYCGCQTGDDFPQDRLTIDHVIPRCRGGSNGVGNLVVACIACNKRKADRSPTAAGMDLLPAGTLVIFPRNRRRVLASAAAVATGEQSTPDDEEAHDGN